MRAAAATVVLAGSGLLTGHALADTVPVPPVPVPAVTVPVVTVPVPPVSTALPATPPGPTPVPAAVAVPAQVAGSPAQVTGSLPSLAANTGAALGGSSATASGAGSASSGDSSGAPPNVQSVRSSRGWISKSGPRSRRMTVLTFTLPHAARVFFLVRQVSPVCRLAGRFSVRAHAGRNQVRIPGRIASLRSLDPGTYRIDARTRAGGLVRRVTIVVVAGGAPDPTELAVARAANVCAASSRLASAVNLTAGASNTSAVTAGSLTPSHPSAAGPDGGSNTHTGAVLGSSVEKAARAVQPLLVALLGVAILLLGIASLPKMTMPDSRAGSLLAHHRVEIAGLGAAALAAVLITLLVR